MEEIPRLVDHGVQDAEDGGVNAAVSSWSNTSQGGRGRRRSGALGDEPPAGFRRDAATGEPMRHECLVYSAPSGMAVPPLTQRDMCDL